MTTPWLSVIIPVFNGARTLGRTLSSLPADHPDIEVLLIDQGSGDDSREIAVAHAGRLNLRIIDAPQNTNWMQNTNLGLHEARAPLVTMLHQDDIWLAGRAEALQGLIARHPKAGMWLHAADYIDEVDRRVGRFAPPLGLQEVLLPGTSVLERLIVQNTLALPAAVFRRDLALRGGGLDEALWYVADWDLWLRLASLAPVAWSPDSLAGFRVHSGSLTITGSRNLKDFGRQLDIPPARYLAALPPLRAKALGRRIAASNAVNLALASRYHRGRDGATRTAPLLLMLLRLGPFGLWGFVRDTRILARVLPRLRLMRRGGSG